MEEAMGYRTLMETYGLTQEETAKAVNKSRPAVANALRLLHLPQEVAEMVAAGRLSAGHARAVLAFEDEEGQCRAARAAVEGDLPVRTLEKMAKAAKTAKKEGAARPLFPENAFYTEVELALSEQLGRRVKVAAKGEKGSLQIEFYGEDDLRDLANRLAPR